MKKKSVFIYCKSINIAFIISLSAPIQNMEIIYINQFIIISCTINYSISFYLMINKIIQFTINYSVIRIFLEVYLFFFIYFRSSYTLCFRSTINIIDIVIINPIYPHISKRINIYILNTIIFCTTNTL